MSKHFLRRGRISPQRILPVSKTFLIFFGPPGSGKGTQAQMLAEKMNLPIISPGELFRREQSAKTKIGKIIREQMDRGELVQDGIIEKIIDKHLTKRYVKSGFIFDGYPRNRQQLKSLIKRLERIAGPEDNVYAVLVDVSDKEVRRRLGGRRVCACGATYHLKFSPPEKKGVCDLCGRQLSIRSDDKPRAITARLKLYHRQTEPLLDYWRRNNRLIEIDGEQSIAKVRGDIVKLLRQNKINFYLKIQETITKQ